MSRRLSILLALVAGLVLAACVPYRSSRTCEEISAANLRALIGETTSEEQAVRRVTEALHIAPKDLTITRAPNNPEHFDLSWRVNGVQYVIVILSSKVLEASMTYESNPPSADEIIQCLGAPDRYWAYYYPPFETPRRLTELHFYFPTLGISCWGHKYGTGDRPPQFDGGTAMDLFDFVPLGSPSEVMDQLVERAPKRARDELEPWPGDWREVEVHYETP